MHRRANIQVNSWDLGLRGVWLLPPSSVLLYPLILQLPKWYTRCFNWIHAVVLMHQDLQFQSSFKISWFFCSLCQAFFLIPITRVPCFLYPFLIFSFLYKLSLTSMSVSLFSTSFLLRFWWNAWNIPLPPLRFNFREQSNSKSTPRITILTKKLPMMHATSKILSAIHLYWYVVSLFCIQMTNSEYACSLVVQSWVGFSTNLKCLYVCLIAEMLVVNIIQDPINWYPKTNASYIQLCPARVQIFIQLIELIDKYVNHGIDICYSH